MTGKFNMALRLKIVERFKTNSIFSVRAAVSMSKLSRVLNGREEAKPEDKKAWAKLLGCSVEDIFPHKNDQ